MVHTLYHGDAMRRLLFGLLWCALFAVASVSALAVNGVLVAWDSCPETEDFDVGYDCGKRLAEELNARYRTPLVVGAVLLALSCTAAGVLPGTKKH